MKEKYKKIIYCLFVIIVFVIGIVIGRIPNYVVNNNGLGYILDIDQWEVKKLYKENTIIYESNDESYISDDQEEGWDKLMEIISIKGYKRNKPEGSTAHLKYKIEMKNGETYYIEYLGCLNQVDVTYPSGKTIKYYGYN